MKQHLHRYLLAISIFFLAGCSFSQRSAPIPLVDWGRTPTDTPVLSGTETVDSPLGQTSTPRPTATIKLTATPFPVTIDPTLLFIPSLTPTPTLSPNHLLLRFESPSPMSKLVSPIPLEVWIAPDYIGRTRIELIGEDGRELYRKVFTTFNNQGYYTRVKLDIDFEIKAAAELARLQVSTFDSYGRMQAYRSMRLILLSIGETQLNPMPDQLERVLLRTPKIHDEISGGVIRVEGDISPLNTEAPFVIELLDENGTVLGSKLLTFITADGSYFPFDATFPYKGEAGKRLPVRLVFRQSDDRIPGLAYLYSIDLFLKP